MAHFTFQLFQTKIGMQINYIILAHKNPEQVRRQVVSLLTGNTYFYIHINEKIDIEPFEKATQGLQNVIFLRHKQRCDSKWGDIGIVKAVLNAMAQIVKDRRSGYCVLMSGQDYPIRKNSDIESFFATSYGINYITLFPMPHEEWGPDGGMDRLRYYKINTPGRVEEYVLLPSVLQKEFYHPYTFQIVWSLLLTGRFLFLFKLLVRRKFPSYLNPCGGQFWWALPIETITRIMAFLKKHPDYIKFHTCSFIPDEIFFQSIINYLFKSDKGTDVIQRSVTYTSWKNKGDFSPATFTTGESDELLKLPDDFLFARKFDIEKDEQILDLIDEQRLSESKAMMPDKAAETNSLDFTV